MHWFLGDDFISIKNILEVFSYLATIVGAGGVIYAVKAFKKSETDSRQSERSERMKNSIAVLKIFSDTIIPLVEESDKKRKAIYSKSVLDYKDLVYKKEHKKLDKLPPELIENIELNSKIRSGCIGIFNQLEQVCAYVAHDLIIEEVVYPTVNKFFLDFCRDNEDLLKYITRDDVPFKNVYAVKKRWYVKANKDSLERQKKKLDEDLAKLDTNQ